MKDTNTINLLNALNASSKALLNEEHEVPELPEKAHLNESDQTAQKIAKLLEDNSLSEEELTEAVKKVVRDGKVVTKKIPTKKKRLTPAQKRALAIARKKAHNGKAELKRAKSMKKARKLGEEDLEEEVSIVCPECGYTSVKDDDFINDSSIYLTCPDCGAELIPEGMSEEDFDCEDGEEDKKNPKKSSDSKNEEEDESSDKDDSCNESEVEELRNQLNECEAPESFHRALDLGRTELVKSYLKAVNMNESEMNETSGLDINKKATNGKAFTVEINGKKYSYFPTPESGLTAKELGQKYAGIAKHSEGRALAWLKKNATTTDSYKASKGSSNSPASGLKGFISGVEKALSGAFEDYLKNPSADLSNKWIREIKKSYKILVTRAMKEWNNYLTEFYNDDSDYAEGCLKGLQKRFLDDYVSTTINDGFLDSWSYKYPGDTRDDAFTDDTWVSSSEIAKMVSDSFNKCYIEDRDIDLVL